MGQSKPDPLIISTELENGEWEFVMEIEDDNPNGVKPFPIWEDYEEE